MKIEEKTAYAIMIIICVILAVTLALLSPPAPACMNTGHEYMCNQSNYKESDK